MIALVAQKFISDVAMDAMQFSRMRQVSTTAGSSEAARKAALLKVKLLELVPYLLILFLFFSKSKL